MRSIDSNSCKVHLLVCTNERPPGGKPCCKRVGGQEFYGKLKDKIRAEGLDAKCWVTRTGCLGFCNEIGTTVVIYKDGQAPEWYNEVTDSDFDTLWQKLDS